MSVQNLPSVHSSADSLSTSETKPLSRVQAYLIELKTCVILLREVLEEFKGLLVIVVLLAVFILEAIHLIFK